MILKPIFIYIFVIFDVKKQYYNDLIKFRVFERFSKFRIIKN